MPTVINGVYRQRHPKESKFYRIVEGHFEEFIRLYPERFENQYGYYRSVITEVIYKYLDCGLLSRGFARVQCKDCKHEYLLAFSCKCRYFCPSCHQKRLIQLGEHVREEVLEKVAHRQIVFSIPKMLRIYFRNDRKLLGKLSRCAYRTLLLLYQTTLEREDIVPGVLISIQTFGDLINFHPHLHAIVSEGCFGRGGIFYQLPSIFPKKIEEVFSYEVFRLLLDEGKITEEVVKKLQSWRHSGFSVHQEVRIDGKDMDGLEGLVQYIGRAPLSEEKMLVKPEARSILYHSKMNPSIKRNFEVFSPLEWLAALCVHIPDKGQHLIRYYGYYSNKSRGMREKNGAGKATSLSIEISNLSSRECRLRWSALIQKIYEVNPLVCPDCGGKMKIIGFIRDYSVIKKILNHLGLVEECVHSPPVELSSQEITYGPICDDFPIWE